MDFTTIHTLSTMHAKFQLAATSREIWEHLYLAGEVVNFDILLGYLEKYSVHTKSLTVHDVRAISHESDEYSPVLSDIINCCFRLKYLELESSPLLNIDFRVYDELAKRLHTLKLRNVSVFPSTLANRNRLHSNCFARIISRFSNLLHIEIINTSNVTVRNIMRILRAMPTVLHVNVQGSVILEPCNVITVMSVCHALHVFQFSHKQFPTLTDEQMSLRKWYHLTMMYYPWVRFAETLTCEIQGYLSTRKNKVSIL